MNPFIENISAQFWQGKSFSYQLGRFTVISGKNMAGKTSILNAVRVALLGHDPSKGNKPGLTFGFAGNGNGAATNTVVAVQIGGKNYAQRWQLNGKSVAYSGDRPLIPSVLLDLKSEYLDLSGPKRAEMVIQKKDVEGFTVHEITARLKTEVKVEAPSAESEKALADLIDDISALDEERHEFKWTRGQWITHVQDRIKERVAEAEKILESMGGLIIGTAQLKATNGPTERFDPEALYKARGVVAELEAQKRTIEAQHSSNAQLRMKIAALESKLSAPAVSGMPSNAGEIEKLRKQAEALEEQEKDYESKTLSITQEIGQWRESLIEIATQIAGLEEQVEKRRAQLKKDTKLGCCPRCKGKGKDWKKALATDEAEIEKVGKDIAQLEAERLKHRKAIEGLEAKLVESRQADAAHKDFVATAQKFRRTLDALQTAAASRNADEAALQALKAELNQPIHRVPGPSMGDLAEAKQKVEALEIAQRNFQRAQADEARAGQARQKKMEAEAEREVCKAALKVIGTVRGEIMAKIFSGFMDTVNLFTHGPGLMPAKLEFADGEIGYWRGTKYVTTEFFSGTEQMLTWMGLSIALAQDSPLKIVTIDEWLRDSETRLAVAERLVKLIQGDVLDQVILIDTTPAGYSELGATVVEV